jgi:BirA family transcriptional regulator, biotin operon repressor / biotin---[acetyl-CoA-carboxylase] ligase
MLIFDCLMAKLPLIEIATMKKVPECVLTLLADGEFHSGEAIGQLLGVSRVAVWKQLQKLSVLGLSVDSVRGKGYRLSGGLDLLSVDRITAALSPSVRPLVTAINLQLTVESTNSIAMAKALAGRAGGHIYLAEHQYAGRGRRGRCWHSPLGQNIYLSIVWEFTQGASTLEGLSLAVAVCIARVLKGAGLDAISLKWPNDILVQQHKLGGILLEMQGDPAGHCQVVVGIGLNVNMSKAEQIDQPWTNLQQYLGNMSRNQLIAALLNELMPMLNQFTATGFGQYHSEWQQLDAYADRYVQLQVGSNTIIGHVLGVTDKGALHLSVDGVEQCFYGGEISMKTLDNY